MRKKEELPGLLSHRTVARLFDVSTKTWTRWVRENRVPVPHSALGTLLYYRADVIEHRLATGKWPEGVRFRGQTAQSDAETRTG